VLTMKKILWKNNLHAVEDLHMKYVNFVRIEIIVSGGGGKALPLYCLSHIVRINQNFE
jgi:hypothetical protein